MAFASCTLPGRGGEIQVRCPVRVQATCRFTPVVWCLPEYSSGRSCHDQQGAKVPSGGSGSRIFHAGHPGLKEVGDQRGVDSHYS